MKKILIINTVPFIMGGMSTVIVNNLNNMNKNDMEITMIVNSRIEKIYEDILKKNGINIIVLERNYKIFKYIYQLHRIMKNKKFDVVHIHGNSSTMAFESIPAYLNNIPIRIVHGHSIVSNNNILNKILWPLLSVTYTLGLSCSREAGISLFKNEKRFSIANNGIELKRYNFNENSRQEIRKELGLGKSFVIGHIGFFNEGKNHKKLFEIVSCLKDKIDVRLLCVAGNYEVPEYINKLIEEYDIKSNIKILLRRKDVNKILQGIDYFIFPSKFEGLGLALIEAQATGIPCLVSTGVPKAVGVCYDLVRYLDLSEDSKVWADLVLDIKANMIKSRSENSNNAINQLKKAGYDITIEAEKLRQIYMK